MAIKSVSDFLAEGMNFVDASRAYFRQFYGEKQVEWMLQVFRKDDN